MDLHDKVIAIVGGTAGLGLSAAAACAAAGAKLAIMGRDDEHCRRTREQFPEAVVLQADASEPDSATQLIEQAVQRFGGLDGMYHVAGGSGRRAGDGPLDQITDDGWQFTRRINLDSLFYSNRAAVRQFLVQQRGGSVLNMASVLGWSASPEFFATHGYATTKAAAIGLTKAAAAYYAPSNIRFNALAPGLFDTNLAQRALGDAEIMRYIAHKQPLDGGRAGHTIDTDAAVVFFLSDASSFVTGQVLAIDGGWSVSEGRQK